MRTFPLVVVAVAAVMIIGPRADAALTGSDYRTAVLALNPLVYYELEQSETGSVVPLSDTSGSAVNHDSTATTPTDNAITYGQTSAYASLGAAARFHFDGTSAIVPNAADLDPTGGFSIAMWINDSVGGDGYFGKVNASRGAHSDVDWDLFSDGEADGGRLAFRGTTAANVANWDVRIDHPGEGEWFFVVATWDGTATSEAVKIYIDGALAGFGAAASTTMSNDSDFRPGGAGTFRTANALFDEIAYFDYGLNATQVSGLYSAALPASIPTPAALPAAAVLLAGLAGRRRRTS